MRPSAGFTNLELDAAEGPTLHASWRSQNLAILVAVPLTLAGVYVTILLLV
jgi:hypothetical protein